MLRFPQILNRDITTKRPVMEQLRKTGEDIIRSREPGPERDVLKCKLADVENRYAAVNEKCADRKEQLDKIAPLVEQYADALHAFLPFLDASEEKLQLLKEVPFDEENASWQKPLIKVRQTFYLNT